MQRRLLLISVAAFLYMGIHAQGREWTLQECIDYALEHNIQLNQQLLAQQQNEVEELAKKAALLPSLSFSTNQNASWRPWNQSYVNLTGGTMTTTSSEVNYNGSYGLNLAWTVWNGGRNQMNVEKSKLTTEMSEYAVQQTANTIQEQIAQYFVQILYQTEAVEMYKQILESSKLQRDRAKTMVEVGSLARVDLVQLESQVKQDEYIIVNAQTMLDQYKLQLKQILELVGDDNFDIAYLRLNDDDIMAPLPSKKEVFESACMTRPEIQSEKLNIQSSELDIDIARRGYLPTLSLNAGIGTSNTSGMHTGVGTQLKNNLNNSIGLTLSVPIFDNRQNRSNVEKAKLSKAATELSLQNTQKELYSQIENYWLNARNAQQQYLSARANVTGMMESYSLVSEQFKLGLKNIVELTTGKDNLLQAQQGMLQSKYTALLNRAMLRFYQEGVIRL